MVADAYLSSVLLVVLIALVLVVIFLLSRKRDKGGAGEPLEVLHERISAKQSEIENLNRQLGELNAQLRESRESNIRLRETLSRQETLLQEERNQHQEKLQLVQNAREQMTLEFKNLANEILEQKGKAFTDSNQQNLQQILKPLSEKIQLFEKKVEESYHQEAKERFSLRKEIENLQKLNARISEDAINLTNALKGESKTQGTWGEVILERVLERSGLVKGQEYEVQVNLKGEDGRRAQPDVIVHLPEQKDVIIDSKVSLSAYERYSSTDDEGELKEALKLHIQSIRNHIKGLSNKDYHNLYEVQSLDFVLMFLPVEAAFSLAVQNDSELFSEAFEKNIILVGPSTLLATLRTIQNIWRYEHQNQHAMEIAGQAGALYDKFVAFAEDLGDIGRKLELTQKSYDAAHNKLVSGRGNLVNRVNTLKRLGARASKKLSSSLLEQANIDEDAEQAGEDSVTESETSDS